MQKGSEWNLIYQNKFYKLYDDGTYCHTEEYYQDMPEQQDLDDAYQEMVNTFPIYFEEDELD